MAEWIVVNGHVLGQCAYLRSLDKPWELPDDCDCRDLLEDDPIWGGPELEPASYRNECWALLGEEVTRL